MSSIYKLMTVAQVDSIVDAIKQTCIKYQNYSKQGEELFYDAYGNHRKQHSVTHAIISRFSPDRLNIDGLESESITYGRNSSYVQPEIKGRNIVFHLYSSSNPINSQLIKNRCAEYNGNESDKEFIVIQYNVKNNRLNGIWAVFFDSNACIKEKESIFKYLEVISKTA